jgi:hypothetical protein
MELKILGRTIHLGTGRIFGLSLVIVGAILLFMALDAQGKISNIGSTNDPILQSRLATLGDQRDTYLVSSIGMLFVGVFGLFVLREPSTPRTISESQMIGAARSADEVISGFSIAGNSSYLPARHGLTKQKMFIPASANLTVPPSALSDDLVLSPGKDGSTPGLLLEPSGLELMNRIEAEMATSFADAGLEAVEGMLQILKHGLDVLKDFHFKERDDKTILRVEYDSLLDACRTVRREKPDTCRRAQCIGCSCLLTAAAKATGKMIQVESVDNSQDTVVFTLVLREW